MKDQLNNNDRFSILGTAHDELLGTDIEDQLGKIWTTKEGVICPCCERSAKVTQSAITRNQIRALGWLYHNTKQGQYVHFNDTCPKRKLVTSASFGKLKHWGLVAQQPNDKDPSKHKSGYVMITAAGRLWLENKVSIHKYRYIYNDQSIGKAGPMVFVKDYNSKDFHYERDIMQPARPS